MKLVVVESPFAGDIEANVACARACMRDCLECVRGHAEAIDVLARVEKLEQALERIGEGSKRGMLARC